MRSIRMMFAIVVLLASASSARADGLQVEPGLWEVSWSMPDPFGGEPVRQVQRACVRDKVVTSDRVNARMKECRISNAVFRGPSAKWKMRCETPAGPMIGSGSLRSNGSAVTGSVQMAMTIGSLEIPVTGAFKGRRVGACR